ncbi:MAG: hypothetical protein E3J86_09780 [Candidatus Thorarchaeota archaeon]|nr:MAG: hypothetical protein E3J86_09780 [Candidatus Thorarchaeota archaeon]
MKENRYMGGAGDNKIQNACIGLIFIFVVLVIANVLGIDFDVVMGWGIYGLIALCAVIVVAILISENWKMYKKEKRVTSRSYTDV